MVKILVGVSRETRRHNLDILSTLTAESVDLAIMRGYSKHHSHNLLGHTLLIKLEGKLQRSYSLYSVVYNTQQIIASCFLLL